MKYQPLKEHIQSGTILIDVGVLCDFLSKNIACSDCGELVSCGIDPAASQGYAHQFVGFCESCLSSDHLFTTSNYCQGTDIIRGDKKKPSEINVRMVSFTRAIGEAMLHSKHF